MSLRILSLLALAAISGALASSHPAPGLAVHRKLPGSGCTTTTCPNNRREYYHQGPHRDGVPATPADLSNGERLVRGLPLKPPTRRSSARRASASPTLPPANRGYIEIFSVDDNGSPTFLGYVSRAMDAQQYGVASTLGEALLVAPSGDRNLITLNPDITFSTFLGLAQDTSSGLLYLTSTQQTSPNATPQNGGNSIPGGFSPSESAVWTRDPVTNILTAQWTNPDGSVAQAIAFIEGSAISFSVNPPQKQKIVFVYEAA
ncbi:hypothetical protein K438DRAFT_1999394 [Mycena galopus ATCC 62051]|nr:hypothetical protein K438DRAFT_1999394 [Mycena galopus ATCC 62051]